MSHPLLEHPPSPYHPQTLTLLILRFSALKEVPTELATAAATLTSLFLEPRCLNQVNEDQFDNSGRKMAKIIALFQGSDAMHSIYLDYGLELGNRYPKLI